MDFVQKKIYPLMPLFIQNAMISVYGYKWRKRRFGGIFNQYLEEVRKREFYTHEQWENFQTYNLRKILEHAFRNVPLYREKYSSAGFNESDFKNFSLKDLKYLPFLEKDELRKYGTSGLLSTKLSRGSFISSSGSTGTPVKIYMPYYFHQKWTALMEARVRNWAGVDRFTPRGMIGGRRILPDARCREPFYRYNIFEKQTYLSAYHLSPETVKNYLQGMIRNKVEYITGYAVSNFYLAKFISEAGLVAPQLKAVITSSEKLTPEMRNTIQEVYRCRCYDSYSGCEACGLISETPEGHLLVSPDAGIMEFIDKNGNYVGPGESGEIVSTGLLNYDQPLIRYRIGDIAKISKNQYPVGGRNMIVIDEIEGRMEDTVITKDGKAMVRFHGLYLDISGLKLGQLIQNDYNNFTLNLIIDRSAYNRIKSEELLKKRLESQVGVNHLTFNYVDKLSCDSNGKIKAVISKLNYTKG